MQNSVLMPHVKAQRVSCERKGKFAGYRFKCEGLEPFSGSVYCLFICLLLFFSSPFIGHMVAFHDFRFLFYYRTV